MRKLSLSLIGLGSLLIAFSVVVWAAGLGIQEHKVAPVSEIAFIQDREASSGSALYVTRKDGGDLRRVKEVGRARSFLWSPDGRYMAFTRSTSGRTGEIYLADETLSDVRQLTHLGGTNIEDSWSPDGKKLLIRHLDQSHKSECFCCCESCQCFYYYVVDVAGRGAARPLPRKLRINPQAPSFLAWRSDGTLLAVISEKSGTALYAIGRDRSIRRLSPPGSDLGMPQVSRDGHVAVVSGQLRTGGRRGLWLIDEDGGRLRWIRGTGESTWYLENNLSPDGRSLAYDCNGICVADIETGRVRRIYKRSEEGWGYWESYSLTWSPDSRVIAANMFFSNPYSDLDTNSSQIAVINADGSDFHYLVPSDADYAGPPYHHSFSWSPDSRWIAFTAGDPSRRTERIGLLVAHAAGDSDPVILSEPSKYQIWNFAWRPVPSSN